MTDLIQESKIRLHTKGGRMTAQRRLILDILERLDTHPTAEELYELVKEKDSSLHLSTVYRTLRWLEDEGLVSSRYFQEDRQQKRFDPVHPVEHYHFVCRSCKSVQEFNNLLVNTIKAQFELHTGAYVEVGSVVLYGICSACLEKEALPRKG